jgi:hypothetical protein
MRPIRISITWLLCSFALTLACACDPGEDTDEKGTDTGTEILTDTETEVVTDLSKGDITLECADVALTGDIYTETATFDLVNACQYWPEESELWVSLRHTEQDHMLELSIRSFNGPGEYVADPGGPEDDVTTLSYAADNVDVTGYCEGNSLADPACATEDQLTTPYCTVEVLNTDLIGLESGVDGYVSFAITCEKMFQTCTNVPQESTIVDPPEHRVEYVVAGCLNQ